MRLKLYTHIASDNGLSTVTTLIIGTKAAALVNPPLLLQDARSVIAFIRSRTSNPLTAIFISNGHPDHYFGAGLIVEAFPTARFFAAPYIVDGIEKGYKEQVEYWSKMVGSSNIASSPTKPEPYNFSFFVLPGDLTSPILLLGPLQGNSSNHTVFWLPTEQTLIAGDVVFARSIHVAVEETEDSASLAAWRMSLDLIYSLDPTTIVAGHVERGTQFDTKKDMEHMYRYLDLFEEKILRPIDEGRLQTSPQELFSTFREAFPSCHKNLDFFLGRMAERFGNGGAAHKRAGQEVNIMTPNLEGFVMGA